MLANPAHQPQCTCTSEKRFLLAQGLPSGFRRVFSKKSEGRGLGGWVKNVKGLRSTNWQSQNSHADVKSSRGNVVNGIVITKYGARWVLEVSGDHFVNYLIV